MSQPEPSLRVLVDLVQFLGQDRNTWDKMAIWNGQRPEPDPLLAEALRQSPHCPANATASDPFRHIGDITT